ncbi:MAG: siderophore-interacting protein [Candidatus Dormibacteria bacterium]
MIALPQPRTLALEVVAVDDISPSFRRIDLSGPDLVGFAHAPGQDLMLVLPGKGAAGVSRRYSIRRADATTGLVELNVVRHGDGPAARWARATQPGERLPEVVGPRGKISLAPGAEWHLFLGDETYVPATLAMLEALPAGSQGVAALEVAGPEDEQQLNSAGEATVAWLHRGGAERGDPERLVRWLSDQRPPPGPGHVYIAGEVRVALALRDLALAQGYDREQLSTKGYWIRGRANADRGEPDTPAD